MKKAFSMIFIGMMFFLSSCESEEEKFRNSYYVGSVTESNEVTNYYTCSICGGTGFLPYAGPCLNCSGTGRVMGTNTVSTEIPVLIERKTGQIVFRGNPSRKCNIPSHRCPGFIPGKDGLDGNYCAACYANSGDKCHSVVH